MREDFDFAWFEDHLMRGLESDRIGGYLVESGLQSYRSPSERPAGTAVRGDLIGQARQLYCLSRGYLISGSPRLKAAALRSGDCLLECFMDPDDGGCYESAGADRTVYDATKTSYGNSHVAFGLAFAARATGEARYRDAAWRSWRFLQKHMTDEHGGMYYAVSRDRKPLSGRKAQNPIMHQFEGLLGLGDCDGCRPAYDDAQKLSSFMTGRLLRASDQALAEYYRDDWTILPGPEEGSIYVGHAFEWAFFLLMAVERGFPREYLRVAERMMRTGLAIGFDQADGGIHSLVLPEGGVASAYKTFWEQCEALRAMLKFALHYGRQDLWPFIDRVAACIRRAFVDPSSGVWYFKVDDRGERTPAGGMHRLDYHTIGLCAEIVRLAQPVP